MKKVFEKIDSLTETYVNILEDIVNIESPTAIKEKVDEVGRYFTELAAKNGWETQIKHFEDFGDVVTVIMNKNASGGCITLSGHMDTVHPVGVFGNPPAKREGDRLYGPGAMDCKGGIVAGFLAMQALSDLGFKERPVRMILQSNEEIGSKDTIDYICETAKDSAIFINLEGHGGNAIKTACLKRKGIARFLFNIKGIETHSSNCAIEGANAIAEAAHKILELEKIKNNDGLTFNCGVIEGGTTPNTVPGLCSFKLDVRFATNAQYEEAKEIVKRVADTVYIDGCTTCVSQISKRVAMELNEKNVVLLNKINEAFIASGLSVLGIGERAGGSDASCISSYGIACIDSVGIGGNGAHSTQEYAFISSLPESAKRIACIIKGLR
ncbi:MAG: M20/M25/M40 family metallo-hydrolase [Clostridia bacterium]|nr:M20/M25/M40 family metallo-hydrolase [Clostridia bacterium]